MLFLSYQSFASVCRLCICISTVQTNGARCLFWRSKWDQRVEAVQALNNLGMVMANQGEYKEAEQHLKEALKFREMVLSLSLSLSLSISYLR
jgi:uncharacterized protein HemY